MARAEGTADVGQGPVTAPPDSALFLCFVR
jgi:hypothetical protein